MPLTLNSHQIQLNTETVKSLSRVVQPRTPTNQVATDMVAGYETCIKQLIDLLTDSGNEKAIQLLEHFGRTTNTKLKNNQYSQKSLSVEVPKIHDDLHTLVEIATDESLPIAPRRLAVVQLASGLNACLGGVGLNVETAILKLNGLKGLSQKFVDALTVYIEASILKILPPSPSNMAGNEIHRAALVYNNIAPKFGLPIKIDTHPYHETKSLLDTWTTQANENIDLDVVIKNLAEAFIDRLKCEYSEKYPDVDLNSIDESQIGDLYAAYTDNIQNQMAREYFSVGVERIFRISRKDDSKYAIADASDFNHTIAKELVKLDIIEPFRAAKLLSLENEGYKYKIKLIGGSIFYVNKINLNSLDFKETSTIEKFALDDFENASLILEKIKEKSKKTSAIKLTENQLEPAVKSAIRINYEREIALAIKTKNLDSLSDCIAAGYGLNSSVAFKFAIDNNLHIVQYHILLGKHPDIYKDFKADHTPLMAAIHMNLNPKVLELLVKDNNFDIEQKDKLGMTAIMHAAKIGRLSDVLFLIRHNADLNARDNNGTTAFLHALRSEQVKIATILKLKGANPEISSYKNFGIFNAIKDFNLEDYATFVFMLNDVNSMTIGNLHPLGLEAMNGNIDRMQILIDNNADVNITFRNGITPLMVAVQKGKWDSIFFLLKNRADINMRTTQGASALTYAIVVNNFEMVKYFIELGADTSAPNFGKKQSALHTAWLHKNQAIIDYIKAHEDKKKLDLH